MVFTVVGELCLPIPGLKQIHSIQCTFSVRDIVSKGVFLIQSLHYPWSNIEKSKKNLSKPKV